MLTREEEIRRIERITNNIINYTGINKNKEELWHCQSCGLFFIRYYKYFNTCKYKNFCTVCNIISANRKKSEVDFYKKLKPFAKKFKQFYFVVQVKHNDLRATKREGVKKAGKLVIDIEIYANGSLEKPLLVIEINENGHIAYISGQDGLNKNYYKKEKYFKDKNIPFWEITYIYNKNNPPYTLFNMKKLDRFLRNIILKRNKFKICRRIARLTKQTSKFNIQNKIKMR